MMKVIHSCCCLLFLYFLTVLPVHAGPRKLQYDGQNFDSLSFEKLVPTMVSRQVEVPSTCYRQAPYSENICNYETRYRNQCETVPGRRVCRNVTEQECSMRPGQRQCHTRNVERCVNRNGRRICRTVPVERCREGNRRQVCRNVVKQRCHREPSRRECRNHPYQDYVCRTETRYRSESYACTKTETRQVEEMRHQTVTLNYDFDNRTDAFPHFTFKAQVTANGNIEHQIVHNSLSSRFAVLFVQQELNSQRRRVEGSFKVIIVPKTRLAKLMGLNPTVYFSGDSVELNFNQRVPLVRFLKLRVVARKNGNRLKAKDVSLHQHMNGQRQASIPFHVPRRNFTLVIKANFLNTVQVLTQDQLPRELFQTRQQISQ